MVRVADRMNTDSKLGEERSTLPHIEPQKHQDRKGKKREESNLRTKWGRLPHWEGDHDKKTERDHKTKKRGGGGE